MASSSDAPVDLYVAAYDDPDAARGDWDAFKRLAQDDVIKVDGLILVRRRNDGNIHVDDDFHEARKGAGWGRGRRRGHRADLPAVFVRRRRGRCRIGAGAGALLRRATRRLGPGSRRPGPVAWSDSRPRRVGTGGRVGAAARIHRRPVSAPRW